MFSFYGTLQEILIPEDLPFSKYYNAQEWESVFILWNTARDID